MTRPPAATPPAPPDAHLAPVRPPLTPEHRKVLKRLRPSVTPALQVLDMYFTLLDGTAEERGIATDVLGRLVDPGNGYMSLAWHIAHDWAGAAHDRYDPIDSVQATAYEIQEALKRPSGRDVLKKGWPWLVRTSARRAREQPDLNGDRGYKSISARAVKDAQKLVDDHTPFDEEDSASDALLDDEPVEAELFDEEVESDLSGDDHPVDQEPADFDESLLSEDGYSRRSVASEMALVLVDLSCNTDYTSLDWLAEFLAEYRAARLATLEDPQREAVLGAMMDDTPMTQGGGVVPELAALGLTRDRANDIISQERLRLHGALVRAAEKSGVASDGFVRLLLERSRSGTAPWTNRSRSSQQPHSASPTPTPQDQ